MKKFLLLIAILCVADGMAQVEYRVADCVVARLYENEAILMSTSGGRRFSVDPTKIMVPDITDPVIVQGREYRFYLVLSVKDIEEMECTGCMPTLPAKIYGYKKSSRQNKLDQYRLHQGFIQSRPAKSTQKIREENPFYEG